MHWSYSEKADGDLAQGDILLPTDELRKALDTAHKWFNDPKYLGFVVISQTCDLVRRSGGPCKTPYIEIAVVRPFRSHVLALLRQQCDWIGDRYFPGPERNRANDLIDRIINQNEASLGIFYLHPEASIGIGESSIVLLRVSIAMRASEHYATLVASRKGRLHPEFANKLGWLCGNLYSRVGIKDWKETEEDQKKASEIRKAMLDGGDDRGPLFVDCPRKFLDDLRKGVVNLQGESGPNILAKLSEYATKPHKERALDAIARVLEAQKIDPAIRTRIRNILNSDSDFASSLRQGST
jgi:hypothetical protein